MNELLSLIILQLSEHLGGYKAKQLVKHFGSASAVFEQSKTELCQVSGIGEKSVADLHNKEIRKLAEQQVMLTEKHQFKIVSFQSENYPSRLKNLDHSPLVLFVYGHDDWNYKRTLGIVGTRNCTAYGVSKTQEIVRELAGNDVCIVSGLARGIDSVSHKAALEVGLPTLAVLGSGLMDIYPDTHLELAKQISQTPRSAVLSQFHLYAPPAPGHFPARNNTVAALSDALLVVESKVRGGSMITADIAFNMNKDVLAIPGRSVDLSSGGCNKLIKQDKARLVENASDIVSMLMWDVDSAGSQKQVQLFQSLNEIEQKIVGVIVEHPEIHIDVLQSLVKMSPSQIAVHMLELELNGLIKPLSGNRFIATN